MFESSMIIRMIDYQGTITKDELYLFCIYLEECPRYVLSENFEFRGHKPIFKWMEITIVVELVISVVVMTRQCLPGSQHSSKCFT